MIKLKEKFRKLGDDFTQVYRDEKIAIYRRSNEFYNDVFEVFKMKVNKPNNVVNDDYEVYPSPTDFGVWAWCCHGNVQLYVCLMEKLGIDKKQAFTLVKSINK